LRQQQITYATETPHVSMWFVAMKSNIHELPAFVKLAHDMGVKEVYMQRLVTTEAGRQGHGLAIDLNSMFGEALDIQQKELIEESEALAAQLNIKFVASGNSKPLESLTSEQRQRPWGTCERPWKLSYITANGNVLPCCLSPCTAKDYEGALLGNAFEQSFTEIWNGDRYNAFRTAFGSDVAPDPCEHCGSKWSI